MKKCGITGYVGSATNPEKVLQNLLDLGGHNNLHLKCDNPNKIYYLLPNKTISCKWNTAVDIPVPTPTSPFKLYAVHGIMVFCAYDCGNNQVWNPGLGFMAIPPNDDAIEIMNAPEDMVEQLLKAAHSIGYTYIKGADVWKFNVTPKSACYFKESMVDMFWSIGVFLGYDDAGKAIIDRGTDSTIACRAEYCIPYKAFNSKVDSTGHINDKLVNKYLTL